MQFRSALGSTLRRHGWKTNRADVFTELGLFPSLIPFPSLISVFVILFLPVCVFAFTSTRLYLHNMYGRSEPYDGAAYHST